MTEFLAKPWFIWAIAVVIGFPLAVAVLGQLVGRFEKTNSPVARTLWYAVNLLLPSAAFFLIIRYVAEAEPGSVGNRILLTIFLVLALFVAVSLFNAVFFGSAPKDSWPARTPRLLRDIILIIMLCVGGAGVLAQVWDQDVTAVLTALGIGSVVLGFALQETLGNVMLGLSLLMERPFSEGDEIKIGDVEGLVEEINWRATRIEVDGNIFVVPHAIAAKETIVNLARPAALAPVEVTVGFHYEHPPNQVRAVLLEALAGTEGASLSPDKPELGVFVEKYADSAVEYRAMFLAERAELKELIIDRFMTRVWYAAQRHGLKIPFPIRTLYHYDGPQADLAAQAAIAPKLRSSNFLAGLIDEDALNHCVHNATLKHYADGETVVEQDTHVPALFIIVAGRAAMQVRKSGDLLFDIYEMERGDFFGEVSLIAGADSPYRVQAKGDLETLSINEEDINRLIEHKPSIAIEIGRIMDLRRKAVRQAGEQ